MALPKILSIILFAVIGIILFSLYVFYISIRPIKFITPETPSDFGLKYEQATLITEDNINLDAWFIPNNNTKNAVLVLHGYPFDKGNILSYAEFLHDDYNLFFIDFRYLGKSQGKYTSVGYHEKKDVNAAVKYLKQEKSMESIGIIGFSLGGSTAIMAATENKEIKAIVADSAYASIDLMIQSMYRAFLFLKWPFVYLTKIYTYLFLGFSTKDVMPVNDIQSLDIPILLIHGYKDSQINVKNSEILKQAYPKAELWIVKDADHGEAHAINKDEYEHRVTGFFKASIG